jgi:hypothetical protein
MLLQIATKNNKATKIRQIDAGEFSPSHATAKM